MGQCDRSALRYGEGIQEALAIFAHTNFVWSNFSFTPGKRGLEMEGFGAVHSGHGAEL